jgi:CheY-like chemotaxis protein
LSAQYRSVETFSKNSCTPEDAPVDANASVSVGLIITELFRKNCVIWWLKIFPLFGWEPSTSESSTLTFEAQGAGSAKEAIRILEGGARARPDIDLVFTDVGMSGAMDGPAVFSR